MTISIVRRDGEIHAFPAEYLASRFPAYLEATRAVTAKFNPTRKCQVLHDAQHVAEFVAQLEKRGFEVAIDESLREELRKLAGEKRAHLDPAASTHSSATGWPGCRTGRRAGSSATRWGSARPSRR